MATNNLLWGVSSGEGYVTRVGSPIQSGITLASSYIEFGETVELTAHPDNGWYFNGWVSSSTVYFDPSSDNPIVLFLMPNNDVMVRASFIQTPPLFCLTTSVLSGQGTIQQPGCSWDEKGPDPADSCAQDFEVGEIIELKASPSSGWSVVDWQSYPDSVFIGITAGATSVQMQMPTGDVNVTVSFAHPNVNLLLDVSAGNGCITIESPVGYSILCGGGIISLPGEEVRIKAVPDNGWEVNRWELDGVVYGSDSSVDFSLDGYASRDIKVYFTEADCDTNTLTVSIEGRGGVSMPSGEYCDTLTLTLNPSPSNGYFFKRWEYSDENLTESGTSLIVPMTADRNVISIFEIIPGYELKAYSLFYCPSETNRTNTIDFDYKNTSEDVSAFNQFHFRATFYTNSEKTRTLYSAFSLADNKRWYYDDNAFRQIPSDGVIIDSGSTMSITYVPEVLPSDLIDTQKEERINDAYDTEFSLLCGSRYYVDIEVYSVDNEDMTFIESISLIVDCSDTEAFYRSYNNDANKWICSAQGNSDLKVSGSMGQSLFPYVSGNDVGLFQIAWQSRRDEVSYIYGSQWDSRSDLLYSAGQGLYDKKLLDNGFNPFILTDQINNFYVTAYTNDSIYNYTCPLPVVDELQPFETTTSVFEKMCYPGQSNLLTSAIDDIKIRVYDEDIVDSIVINKDNVIPVVDKQQIRLDIDGINSLYAVRLRDSNDSIWSDWINIDTILYETEGVDITVDAYKIDNNRVVVPWRIDRINGIRRICCQLLTLYGVTPTTCIDIFINMDNIEHTVEFYTDSDLSLPVTVYNGYPILSQVRDENGAVVGNNDDGTTTIYVKVIFSEDILTVRGGVYYYGADEYRDGEDITFNMVQQGVEDIWGLILKRIDNKTFKGEFNIYKHDGVYNKDGRAFIQVLLPDSIGGNLCFSDSTDPYNFMVNSADSGRYTNLIPQEVYKQYKMSKIPKLLDVNSFKQYYNIDDNDFKFGNPDLFRK